MGKRKSCGDFWRHTMEITEGGWKSCTRCGALSSRGVPPEVRFWSHVDKNGPNGCWLWTGGHHPFGHGHVLWKGKTRRAHRVAWELLRGPLDAWRSYKDPLLCHKCDNPRCVNPDHMFIGSSKDNLQDMVCKGRSGMASLTPETVREIRARHKAGEAVKALADTFKASAHSVYMIVTGRTWKTLG